MDFLYLVAELAAAFAGFTALVSVFQDPRGRERTINLIRLQQMLELSLLVVGLCLLPDVILATGTQRETAFRTAAVLGGAAWLLLFVVQIRRGFSARVQAMAGYNKRYARFLVFVGFLSLASVGRSAFGSGLAEGPYVVTVALLLLVAGLQFVRACTSMFRDRLDEHAPGGVPDHGVR